MVDTDGEISELEIRNRNIANMIAREGMVLLENTGILPLSLGKIALYGSGARHTVKGGKGSGDVNDRHDVTVEEGLKKAGFKIMTERWLDRADVAFEKDDEIWAKAIDSISEERQCARVFAYLETEHKWFKAPEVLDEDIPADTDTAIYVIGRRCGEGCDRTNTEGDFKLYEAEKISIQRIARSFKKVVVVINSGGQIETSFFHNKMKGQGALIYMGIAGEEAGSALADILTGSATPSGKLSATWGHNVSDWGLNPASVSKDGNVEVVYNDGALPGYRGFNKRRILSSYPFGYGLSYASFSWEDITLSCLDDLLCVTLTVHNRSLKFAGADVVELYADIPSPKKDDADVILIGYAKTKVLAPNENERVKIEVEKDRLALWDEENEARIIRKGTYNIYLGHSCVDLIYAGEWKAPSEVLIERLPRFKNCMPQEKSDDQELFSEYSNEELIKLVLGDYAKAEHSVVGAASGSVAGAAGYTTDSIASLPSLVLADGPAGLRLSSHYELDEDWNIINVGDMDGLEGGRYAKYPEIKQSPAREGFQWCTCFPTGTLVAQSWDRALAKELGRAISDEMIHFGVDLWLAPGMNIQRDPLCGRNYEYYSEDPLLAGLTAASVVEGVEQGRCTGAVIKHFACNNFENGRLGGNSIVSSKGLYDIYLRAFEIAIKAYSPTAIMTSYNKLNGVQSAESYMLCTKLLREVWHYEGSVMSDWGTTDFGSDPVNCIKAGNDLIMPGSLKDELALNKAVSVGRLSRNELIRCAKNVIKAIDRCRSRLA